MATQGRGDFPLRSTWFRRRQLRRSMIMLDKPAIATPAPGASLDVFSEWFFDAAAAPGTSIGRGLLSSEALNRLRLVGP